MLEPTDLSDVKTIHLVDDQYISLRELFQTIFGLGCEKEIYKQY